MGNLVNLVGKRFGMLTVVKRDGKNSCNHVTWECVCDCGETSIATGNNLRAGHTNSCGCLKKTCKSSTDLSGQVFGKLTIQNDGHRIKKTGAKMVHVKEWRCLCVCGTETYVTTGHITTGHTNSCGCWAKENARKLAYKNLAGKKKVAPNGTLPPRKNKNGYVCVHDKNHPRAYKSGFVMEHIKVMSESLGRDLLPHENVHHLNGDRADNRIENLELWSKSQPCGQRVVDKLKHAVFLINEYRGEGLEKITLDELVQASKIINKRIKIIEGMLDE